MIQRSLRALIAFLSALGLLVACQSVRNSGGPDLQARPVDALRLATYNVHYIVLEQSEGRWSRGAWEDRKGPLDAVVKAIGADLIAFQEMESFSRGSDGSVNLARDWLLERNPDYGAAATGDWREFPSTQPIFYRRDRLEVLDQGWFFFSETPDVLYSRTFDGSYPAFASWAQFRNRTTGESFRLLNLHTDYASRENRRRSVALVAERIEPWIDADERVFLAGDLNARHGSALHGMLEAAGLSFVRVEGATYHFDRGLNLFGAIDHIGYSRAAPVSKAMVYREKPGRLWPTDHYPVVADFDLR